MPKWLSAFMPAPAGLSFKQRVTIAGGVFVGILVAALLCGVARLTFGITPWLMAPLGASAIQLFSVPGSPMSQPWPAVAGHVLSAMAGLVCYHLLGHTSLAAASAVALATVVMIQFRALHPSGGGTALLVVLTQTGDWSFVLFPVIPNAIVLVLAAMAWHRLTGHAYPKRQTVAPTHTLALHRFVPSDLEAALAAHDEALDISRADIERLIELTELNAYRRMADGLTCGDIMMKKLHTVEGGMNARVAERLMLRHDVNALPVIDADRRVKGLLRIEEARAVEPGQAAEEVMLRDYFRRGPDAPAAELIDLFEASGRRYAVVQDDDGRLLGLVAKSDLMRRLFHEGA